MIGVVRVVMLVYAGMYNIMEADVEQISQLLQFAEAMLEYHKQCSEILQVGHLLVISVQRGCWAGSPFQNRIFYHQTGSQLKEILKGCY